MDLTWLFVLLYLINSSANGQLNECYNKNTCSQCISSSPKCTWCEDTVYKFGQQNYYQRCNYRANHEKQKCKKVADPIPMITKIQAKLLEGETRVYPQKIHVQLRPGQPTEVNIKVKTPINFPIDLYYLMDLSLSMKDDLTQIQDLGERLGKEMAAVTSNFRLGFGGFVDKPVSPYTWVNPDIIETRMKTEKAQKTFSYKNYLSLSENTSRFEEVLKKDVEISFNIDEPEGSLDALMQVMACKQQIGWRDKKKARRIIIITTDATFHFSGDGLLGGFVKRNDGFCYLENGTYVGWNKHDYPSLSQIRKTMLENQIVPIFATTNNTQLYKKVASFFGDASGAVAQVLKSDSSNVVPLIQEAYKKIAKIVSITSDAPDGLEVKYKAQCKKDGEMKDANLCDNISLGDEVSFVAELTAKDCRIGKNASFKIETTFDSVEVNLDVICDCECEKPVYLISNSSQCSSVGSLVCGSCSCHSGYLGRFCQCNASEDTSQNCRGKGDEICSGIGTCVCEECECPQPKDVKMSDGRIERNIIYGSNGGTSDCDCDTISCPRSNGGLLCGGPERGTCDCRKCVCAPEWTGVSCADKCLKTNDTCFDQDGVMCSGRGQCICGRCNCGSNYIGELCQECVIDCPDPCRDYRECVSCKVFETSELNSEPGACEAKCKIDNITQITTVKKVEPEDRCVARDKDECSFFFTWKKNNITNEVELIVQEERLCPEEPAILWIIVGVILGIVFIGLALLLIWKLLATIQDRQEFAKFEKDRQNANWETAENPIFKQATSTFQNPTFGGK